jgi:hypothetical protein
MRRRIMTVLAAAALTVGLLASAASAAQPPGQLGYEGQPGNQGNGLLGYEGQPGNQGG